MSESKTKFTEKDVEAVAHLARLALNSDEIKQFAVQLGDILSYVNQLSEVDVSGVEILSHPTRDPNEPTPLRPDEPVETIGADEILKSAPKVSHQSYEVPPFV